uniref:AlNc14C420G11512 protein n=1 Tax=Albugo laibachii Nc14 TaxID=890382 RepID=F0WZA9_9STRA|nr:AlNc14C420G11512 [Albugo laibachii Nc14]|eukprot:CCA26827.1 AlNc14C420G11512 [Albugo laibachii Nc14]
MSIDTQNLASPRLYLDLFTLSRSASAHDTEGQAGNRCARTIPPDVLYRQSQPNNRPFRYVPVFARSIGICRISLCVEYPIHHDSSTSLLTAQLNGAHRGKL